MKNTSNILSTVFCGIVLISSFSIKAQTIEAGTFHSFFLCNDNTPMACGSNVAGQLGNGTTVDQNSPILVTGLTGVKTFSGGANHSLFLKNDGTVWSCGNNANGQLGDGTTTQRNSPVQVLGLSDIKAISAGGNFSLFLKNDSTVWVCGRNSDGQLGTGTFIEYATPVQIGSLSGIVAISAGNTHSLFLKSDSTVWACGDNYIGQLGDGTNVDKNVPFQITSLSGIKAISAGEYHHSLFLKSDGTVWSCGNNNNGGLGNGTVFPQNTPGQVSGLTNIIAISAGDLFSLFLKSDLTAWACGYNTYGQLGDGTTVDRHTPIQVIGLCSLTTGISNSSKNIVVLEQNVPNPFAEQTTISYYIPNNVKKAQIVFLDQTGKIIKAVELTEKGKGQLNVFANDLSNGIYTYSLIVDGQTVETKKMIRAK